MFHADIPPRRQRRSEHATEATDLRDGSQDVMRDCVAAGPGSRIAVALALLVLPVPVQAQTQATHRLPPVVEALTAPFSDNELAGIGCLVGTTVAGGAVMALAGGPGAVAAALQGPLPPVRVLEGGAALAFLVSSACYVGQALTPVVMLGWDVMTDMLSSPAPAH